MISMQSGTPINGQPPEQDKEDKEQIGKSMVRSETRHRKYRWIWRRALGVSTLLFCAVFFLWPIITDKMGLDQGTSLFSLLEDQAEAKTALGQDAFLDVVRTVEIPETESGEDMDILILVNKHNALPEDYVPSNLTPVTSTTPAASNQQLAVPAAEAFEQLAAAAKAEGNTIKLVSGFRSYATQERLYNSYVRQDGSYAARYSAEPGRSEHQTGLAADVSSPSVEYDLVQSYGSTKEGIWLAENAHKFGFILRYFEGSEPITGYIYEPWHIRYVGVDAAEEIYKKGLTLEEYLGVY